MQLSIFLSKSDEPCLLRGRGDDLFPKRKGRRFLTCSVLISYTTPVSDRVYGEATVIHSVPLISFLLPALPPSVPPSFLPQMLPTLGLNIWVCFSNLFF